MYLNTWTIKKLDNGYILEYIMMIPNYAAESHSRIFLNKRDLLDFLNGLLE